ncbi:GNAT family N-acetyltransferase [Thermococcus thioreducens]|uniref:GNAT family acetyltransferase n=1 Tax=Thermococcus thioreducens TaxID=277988 RepID=A0A0Q2MP50_9EURY|nr:GNAT family N-acetyltransferase [Thermococcus thioreducens]ASJ12991.1 GNAT family acetyltransferase [Thermococcus thioreducens]KQH81463.1 GNAT family acetyltransferase [Thermococcus thioreducens]SEV82554.1 N-acetylglutamate synthase, GNAT family [Thermococcus thioreducens]
MKPIIREAKLEDKPFIEEIASLTWGGEDYLARVFDEWLGDNFYVLEVDGKVIGTAKLTLLPGKVGWLEGLRVHPDYRGRGYGRKLHSFMLELGERLAREGEIEALEFSTYFLNRESIAMAKRDGFSITAKFFNLGASVETFEPERAGRTELSMEDLAFGIIPLGWKFVHRSGEALDWLREKGEVYEINGFKFLAPKGEVTFTPLSTGLACLKAMLPGMAWVAREKGRGEFDIMIPSGMKPVLPGLKRLGLFLWDETEEPNVLVFRKKLV